MARTIFSAAVCTLWALWFGGLAALFLFATRLFVVDRDVAIKAAPILFVAFEWYQLILAVIAMIGVIGWRIAGGPKRVKWIGILFAISAVAAIAQPVAITGPMEALRVAGRTDTRQFKMLHGIAMLVYTGETVILFGAGLLMPGALRASRSRE